MEGAGRRGGGTYSDARSPLREQVDYGVSLAQEFEGQYPPTNSRIQPREKQSDGGVNVSLPALSA